MPLLFAADDPIQGLIVLVIFLLFIVGALFAGFKLGRKSAIPESVYESYKKSTLELEERKNEYKHLVELMSSRVTSVGALAHALSANVSSAELDKLIDAIDSFEDLLAHNDKLHSLTPVREIDISKLLEAAKRDG